LEVGKTELARGHYVGLDELRRKIRSSASSARDMAG